MDMYQNAYMTLPGISPEEIGFLQRSTAELNENQQKYFYMVYSGKRRSPQDMLMFCLIGFFVPGLQRFLIGQIGMGFLYLFTGGICVIGTIIDIVNYQSLALEYNQKMAYESFHIAKMSS